MPTQKQISASIDAHLAKIQAGIDMLLAAQKPAPPVVVAPAQPLPPVTPPVVTTPVVVPPVDPAGIVDLGTYRRGRSGLPKIARTPAQLGKLVLPYDRSAAIKADVQPSYAYQPGAYGSLGLAEVMGSTGERQELGLTTDAQADWLMGGSANNMLAQAEAHGSVPVHALIDGRVVDHLKNPGVSFRVEKATTFLDFSASPVKPDTAHYPALSYVPFLATGDLYYLQELQFAATYHIIGQPIEYAQWKGTLWPWQERQMAWGLRDIIAAYIATPEGDLPAPLLPKSYWKTILDNNIASLTARYVNGSDPLVQNTGIFTVPDHAIDPWQQDYISMVLGWAVWTGQVPQIRPLYDFQIRQAVIRATGPLRSQAMQYGLTTAGTDWPSLLAANGKTATPDGHYDAVFLKDVPQYPGLLRGALKVAVLNGVPKADEAFAYADSEAKRNNYIPLRWAV